MKESIERAEKELLIKRFREIKYQVDNEYSKHKKFRNMWGVVHITLGIIATFSATLSACFTFSSIDNITIVLNIISAISAGSITSINPSKREQRRRQQTNIYSKIKLKIDRESIKFQVNSRNTNRDRIKRLIDIEDEMKNLYDTLEKIQ